MPSRKYTRVLICRSAGAAYCSARSSMVRTPGVAKGSGEASNNARSAESSTAASRDVAFSMLAA